jgi:hypothetical protein
MVNNAAANVKVLITVIILSALSLFAITYGDTGTSSSGFMNLEASIKELQRRVEKLSPGVALIIVYDDTGKEIRRGSGFFINREGRIITNALLLEDAYSAEIFSESNHYDDVTILSRDNNMDLALLQVGALNEFPLEFDFNHIITPGERVMFVGKSADLEKTVSEGLITAVSIIEENLKLIEIDITAPISTFPTSKDGPLINLDNKVIGVITSIMLDDQVSVFIERISDIYGIKAVSAASVRSFLSKPVKAENLHAPRTRIFSRWITSWLKTTATNWFVFLYNTGFRQIMKIVVFIAISTYLIHFSFLKLKKIVRQRMERSKRV